jgi:hypothetical protein
VSAGQSTSSKGKGKWKNKTVSGGGGESDSAPDVANGDDDYIAQTGLFGGLNGRSKVGGGFVAVERGSE